MIRDKNYVELSGCLTKDIKFLTTDTDGRKYGIVTIMVNKYYRDSLGVKKQQISFFDIFIWHLNILELYGHRLIKNTRVIVRGELANSLSSDKSKVLITVNGYDGISILLDLKEGERMKNNCDVDDTEEFREGEGGQEVLNLN
jgi:hypothetical protein